MNNSRLNSQRKLSLIAAVMLLTVLFLQCISSAWTLGQTVDETYYNGCGYPIVRHNNYEFLGEHPPLIIGIGAIPLLFLQPNFPMENYVRLPNSNIVDISRTGALFLYEMGNNPQIILFLERLAMILLTVILGFGIFLFGREIYGELGALLALGLYVFTPDIIGHGSIYMTDMGLTVFYFFAIYAVKKFFDEPSGKRATIAGIACGLAFMSKISSLILIPIVSCLFLIYYMSRRNTFSIPDISSRFRKIVIGISIFLIANAIGEKQAMVIWGPFLLLGLYLTGRDLFPVTNLKWLRILFKVLILGGAVLCVVFSFFLKKYYGHSIVALAVCGTIVFAGFSLLIAKWPSSDNRIRLIKYLSIIWIFSALTIVLLYTDNFYKFHRFIGFEHYIRPLGIVLTHFEKGHGSYVPGSFITNDWKYFPLVMAVKTPLLVLILAGVGALLVLVLKQPGYLKGVLLLPVVIFLAAAMANKINIGIRHILPIYPFIFLLGGLTGASINKINNHFLKKILLAVLLFFFLLFSIRTLKMAPDYFVYFNEAVGSVENGSKILPSNAGQDNKALSEFVLEKKIPLIRIANEISNADVYDYYKIPWQETKESDWANPAPGFYALGIGVYLMQQKVPDSWFKGKEPLYRVGKTVYIFEIPEK